MTDDGQKCIKRFTYKDRIGSGAYSSVHSCVDENGEEYAVKLETSSVPQPALTNELSIYSRIREICDKSKASYPTGIPVVHHFAQNRAKRMRFIILERLGVSLLDIMKKTGCKFSMKSVLTVGSQMIERLRVLHKFDILHRDIKPDNILIGWKPERKDILHITDFGISRVFRNKCGRYSPSESDAFDGLHIFSSHRAHHSLPQTERDDLESLLYSLVFLARGKLPWASEMKSEDMGTMKKTIPTSELCHELPASIVELCESVKGLDFMETPDYEKMKAMFEEDLANTDSEKLDWE